MIAEASSVWFPLPQIREDPQISDDPQISEEPETVELPQIKELPQINELAWRTEEPQISELPQINELPQIEDGLPDKYTLPLLFGTAVGDMADPLASSVSLKAAGMYR